MKRERLLEHVFVLLAPSSDDLPLVHHPTVSLQQGPKRHASDEGEAPQTDDFETLVIIHLRIMNVDYKVISLWHLRQTILL